MDGEQRQQLADVGLLAGLHDDDDFRLGRYRLEGPQGHVQIGDRVARVVVAPGIDELPHEEIRHLLLQGAVEVAGGVETLRRDAQFLVQVREVDGEGGGDQGVEGFHGERSEGAS